MKYRLNQKVSSAFRAKKLLSVFALSMALGLPTTAPAHEVVLLVHSEDQDLLPLITEGDHLSAAPQELDFGDLALGQSLTRSVDLSNTSTRTLTVTPGVAAPLTVVPAGPSTLAPGAVLRLDVTAQSGQAVVLDQSLTLEVAHHSAAKAQVETVPITGRVVQPPQLQVDLPQFGLVDVQAFDFGYVTQQSYPAAAAPSFEVVISNVGDPAVTETAFDVTVGGGLGGTIPGLGACLWQNPVSEVCIAKADGQHLVDDIAPGQSVTTTWRLFPYEADWFSHSYTIRGSNTEHLPFELTGGFVPFSLPDGPFLAAQTGGAAANTALATKNSDPYQGFGRSTDPLGPDPLKSFMPEGFDPRALFSAGEPDHVEARTGSVVLPIPLGDAQPARAGLAYELNLVVNSRIWKRETNWGIPRDIAIPGDGPRAGAILERFEGLNSEFPNPAYNAAPGVALHMGRLAQPLHFDTDDWYTLDLESPAVLDFERVINSGKRWVYIDQSGYEHVFFLKAHGDEPLLNHGGTSSYRDATVLYTRDDSYMRLRLETVNEGGRQREIAWLDLPNGQTHLFEKQADRHPTLGDRWLLQRMEDRFGNAVTIDYTSSRWHIRTGRVSRAAGQKIGTVSHDDWRDTKVFFAGDGRPTRVEHLGYKGLAANKRIYTFGYSNALSLERPARSTFHTLLEGRGIDTSRTIRTLDSVHLPDGTSWQLDWRLNAAGREMIFDGFTLPTGAQVRYQHAEVWPTSLDCGNGGRIKSVFGVVRRWALDGSTTVSDRYFLRQHRTPAGMDQALCQLHANDSSNAPPRAEHRVAVWSQQQAGLSTVSVQYFNDYPFASGPNGWTANERSAPITRSVRDPDNSAPRFLSSRVYSCDRNAGSLTVGYDQNAILNDQVGDRIEELIGDSTCQAKETTYAAIQVERETRCTTRNPDCIRNHRRIDQRVVYHDDSDKWLRRQVEDYDGVGNYRKRKLYSNFQVAGGELVQTTFRDHNPGLPVLRYDNQHRIIGTWNEPSNWVFHDYGIHWTEDRSGVKRGGEAVFDNNGLLRLDRTWRLGGPRIDDIVVKSAYNPSGELEIQRYFGADTYGCGSLPSGSDWSSGQAPWNDSAWNPGCQDYSVQYRYSAGVLSEQFVTGTTERQVDRVIDARTGWTVSDRLDSGELVRFDYDRLGRLESALRSHAANHTYAYTRPGNRWRVTVRTYPAGTSSGTPIRTYLADYDGLGRLARQEVPGYDGSPVVRLSEYHPGGAISRFNSLDFANKWTSFDYDYRNRLLQRTNPDASTVVNTYWGDREVRVRTKVDTPTGRRNADTLLESDALGRVVRVTLPEGAVNDFTYDALGQLTSATRGVQVKSYGTDGRGFRTSEQLPERSSGGFQLTTRYSDFDTRGNARRMTEGSRVSSSEFDALGRLTELAVNGRTVKSFRFGAESDGASHGQLVEATRYNDRDAATSAFGVPGTWRVTSSYGHDAAARVSARTTEVSAEPDGSAASGTTFHQTWTYDDVGNVDHASFPVVTAPAAQVGKLPAREVNPSWAHGYYLTSVVMPNVSAMAAHFTYHKSGLVATVAHAGTAGDDVYGIDPTGMPRWGSIHLAGGARHLGTISYDPSSNITAIGGDSFRYDRNNRLVQATVNAASETYTKSYDYDPYDNILAPGFGTVDSSNNRLVGGTDYDEWGNLTLAAGVPVIYDELDKVVALQFATYTELAIYDHDDLRVLFVGEEETATGRPTWTLRDLEGRVMREASGLGSNLRWEKDYVYGTDRMVSSYDRFNQRRHYHTDQLGTSRYISTNNQGGRTLDFRPFGAVIGDDSGERAVGFATHERQDSLFATYMRGRNYLHGQGRFLQVDPARASWNAYSYGNNNPIGYIDPSGEIAFGVAKRVVKLAIKGGDVAATFAGVIEDFNTVRDPNASVGDRLTAALSLATEIASPVSVRDAKAVAGIVDKVGDSKRKLSRGRKGNADSPADAGDDVGQASDGTGAPERARQKGERFKSTDDPQLQLEEIEAEQENVRKGKSKKLIDSIEKSKQRLKHHLKGLRHPEDLEDE